MRKVNIGILVLVVLASLTSCKQQSSNSSKLLVNEVLIENRNNFQDDYGRKSAWIEIFNKSYGSVDIAGHILEVTVGDEPTVEYVIPKGDVLTKISPRQHLLFWADGKMNRGTFHTNFKLDNPNKSITIRLLNQGKKLLDEVTIPAGTLHTDHSYGRVTDGSEEWEIKGRSSNCYVSPCTNNSAVNAAEKKDKFSLFDPSGVGMALSAICVVFCGLLVLFLIFKTIGIISQKAAAKQAAKSATPKAVTPTAAPAPRKEAKAADAKGEVFAAIALALHEMQADVHDNESMVLTIKHVSSAWCPKTATLREMPVKK